jgi:hypothetical protein
VWECTDCLDCDNCRRCNNADGFCDECNLGYFRDDSSPKKCVLCTKMLTTFSNNIPACPTQTTVAQCTEFVSDGVCRSCESTYFLAFNPTSCITCNNAVATNYQYYHDCDDTYHCLQSGNCVVNCNKCITPQECQTCADLYYLTDDKLCAKCPDECTKCTAVKTCTNCVANYFLTSVGSCITCTSDGQTIADPNCYICALANCKTCTGDNSNDCSLCRTGFYLLTVGSVKSCDQCQVGYTIDGTNCRKCADFMCINCGSDLVCLECSQGYYLKTNGGAVSCDPCVSASSPGWYRSTSTGRIDQCLQADTKRSTCTEFAPADGTVCRNCGSSKIKFTTASADTECIPCTDTASQTVDGLYCYFTDNCTKDCQKCLNSYQCQTCANNYFITTQKTCVSCKSECSKCISTTGCTECASDRCLLEDDCILYTTEGIASSPGCKIFFSKID